MSINTFKIYSVLKPSLTFFFFVNKEKLVVTGIKLTYLNSITISLNKPRVRKIIIKTEQVFH